MACYTRASKLGKAGSSNAGDYFTFGCAGGGKIPFEWSYGPVQPTDTIKWLCQGPGGALVVGNPETSSKGTFDWIVPAGSWWVYITNLAGVPVSGSFSVSGACSSVAPKAVVKVTPKPLPVPVETAAQKAAATARSNAAAAAAKAL